MKLITDYLLLRKTFSTHEMNQPFPITIAELAQALFYTTRNVNHILNKMSQLGWIAFESGRGRGHSSQMTFLVSSENLLLQECMEMAKRGDMESVFRLLREFGTPEAKNHFIQWLSGYFGYEVSVEQSHYRETIRLPIYRKINTLDPAECFFRLDSHMVKQLFNTLVEFPTECGLAHHWKRNEEATSWTLFLYKGVRFHHGKELSADDVVYTFKRMKENYPHLRWLVDQIQEVRALSPYVVQFVLSKPNHLFLQYLAYTPSCIIPSDGVLQSGTGPYKLAKKSDGILILEAFTDYFKERAHIDVVEIINIPEENEDFILDPSMVMVQTGEGVPPHSAPMDVHDEFVSGSCMLSVNLRKEGPLQNIHLRKALTHMINRARMIWDLGDPRFYPSSGFNLQMRPRFIDMDYELDKAKSYLALSEYKGETLALYTYKRHEADARWLKEQLRPFGIMVSITILTWREMQDPKNQDQADFILFEAILSEGEVQFIELFQSGYSFIHNHLSVSLSAELDEVIEEALAEPTEAARKQKLDTLEQKLKKEYACIFLVHKNIITVSPPSLKGVKINEKGWIDFKDLWFDHTSSQDGSFT
ncbi:ABC transporter substrate-binding protein [Ammoniphilus sp. CFH 90114]|uniref:ABC transporter substrate-binding protein n=1 Tax=Ammoniphilus sp. CFH 90114 TaxID=2493665 RepID=UPI00100EC0F3|nr:ABC transporter substrate-binding protein [Ammoniphilus sp. CFH 90114]RXT07789.1 hypothetical protein EIZ39_10175 [Ammoniphilus sp. CFH 90114]